MFNNKRKNENTSQIVFHSPNKPDSSPSSEPVFPERKGISKSFIALISIIFLGAVAAYFLYSGNDREGKVLSAAEAVKPTDAAALQRQEESVSHRDSLLSGINHSKTAQKDKNDPNASAYTNAAGATQDQSTNKTEPAATEPENTSAYGRINNSLNNSNSSANTLQVPKQDAKEFGIAKTQYKVVSKAYFYSRPNYNSRSANFISHWKKSYTPLNALDTKNGFMYVVFTDESGKTKEGWLRKKDVKPVKTIMYASDSK